MKNQKEKIDLLFKDEIGSYEVAPPSELKEKVFIELNASGFYDKKRRNLIITLILFFISSIAVISLLFIKGNEGNNSGATANINISKAELFEKNPSITSESHKERKTISPYSKKSNPEQKKRNSLSENKSSKTKPKKDSNNSNTISNNDGPVTKQSNNNTNNSADVNNENQDIIINEGYSVNEKKPTSKNASAQISDNLLLPDKIPAKNYESFSLYDKGINEQYVKNVRSNQPLVLSIGLNAGHSLIQSPILNISKTNSEDNNNYSYKMDWPSGSIGLNVKIEKKHFFAEAGLQISKFTENISTERILSNPRNFQNINTTQNSLIDTTGGYFHYFYISDSNVRIIDSLWTWNVDTSLYDVYDTIKTNIYDTLNNPSWKNSYTFFDLPLTIGWQTNLGRFNLGIKTGPIINMLIATKGVMPSQFNGTIIKTDINEGFKKYQFGLSWQASVMVGYYLSSNLMLECAPYYRFTLIGIKPVNSDAAIKNNSFGLQLGLRYYF